MFGREIRVTETPLYGWFWGYMNHLGVPKSPNSLCVSRLELTTLLVVCNGIEVNPSSMFDVVLLTKVLGDEDTESLRT